VASFQQELQDARSLTINAAEAARPINTKRSYQGPTQEFIAWCVRKGAPDGNTVTESKLNLFLIEEVIGRESRVRRRGESERSLVRYATVSNYIAAITDLYKNQVTMCMNSHPNPRMGTVKSLLQSVKRNENVQKRSNYVDRGIGTIQDGFSGSEQIERLSDNFFSKGTTISLRNRMAFLLSHSMVLRGESIRMAQFPDLFSLPLTNEGIEPCPALILVLSQSKTNQYGRLNIGACLRTKNVRICPFGSLALYLFCRFHIDNEEFPDFSSSNSWYDTFLLRNDTNPNQELSYRAHNAFISECMRECNIATKSKTHATRGSGARLADLGGASDSQIRRLGRWNTSAMEGCYLSQLPREAMRVLAGFPSSPGSFFLKRAQVNPAEELQSLVFPQVEHWLTRQHENTAEQNIAAGGFLLLLKTMRAIVLQDAVALQQFFPDHFLFQHPIFQTSLFNQFKTQLEPIINDIEEPETIRLHRVIPDLMGHLDSRFEQLEVHRSIILMLLPIYKLQPILLNKI
jgi:hypothetical protein